MKKCEKGVRHGVRIGRECGIKGEEYTIEDIKKYKPKANSLSSGQVLSEGYKFDKAKIVVKEMMDTLALDLVSKKLVTNHISLAIGYDIDNLKDNKAYTFKVKCISIKYRNGVVILKKIMMVMGILLYFLMKLNINTVMADFLFD